MPKNKHWTATSPNVSICLLRRVNKKRETRRLEEEHTLVYGETGSASNNGGVFTLKAWLDFGRKERITKHRNKKAIEVEVDRSSSSVNFTELFKSHVICKRKIEILK